MKQNREKLSGVFAPVVTPFHCDELALDQLRFNLQKLNETGLTGYLALGSNGEFRSLSDTEQIEVLEVFAEAKGDKVVMVGTGCESTKQTIEHVIRSEPYPTKRPRISENKSQPKVLLDSSLFIDELRTMSHEPR